jgi:ApbE superfamily uncharacterized protein (UPF0280 family)
VTIVPAQGSNTRIVLVMADVSGVFNAGLYTNINANDAGMALNIGANNQSSWIANDNAATPAATGITNFFGTAKHNMATLVPDFSISSFTNGWGGLAVVQTDYVGTLVNAPLAVNMYNTTNGNLTGGNSANTMTIRVWYTVVAVP